MHDPISQQELGRLIDAICDRSINEEDAARLNAALATDPVARTSYLQQVWMDAELFASFMHADEDHPDDGPQDSIDAELARIPASLIASAGAGEAGSPRSARSRLEKIWSSTGWLTIAAALLVSCFGSGWLAYQGARGHGPLAMLAGTSSIQGGAANELAGKVVGSITGSRDCRWSDTQAVIGYGSLLHVGQTLELQEGLVEVTFKNGARLVLEGPARFLVPDADQATLLAGRMSAAVPRTAAGFTVSTHRLTINNAGAQFGLVAYANGGSEVHVFEGPVHARAIDTLGREIGSVQLSATEAARLAPVAADFALFNANGDGFVRTLARSIGPSEGLLAVEEFDYPVGPLAWQNGGFGWAEGWADLNSANPPDEPSSNAVAEGSLAGSELISQGNRAIQTTQFNRARRVLSTSLRGVFDVAGLVEDQDGIRLIGKNGTTVYVSFMQRVSVISDGFYGFELHRGDGNPNRVLSVGYGAESTGYGISSNYNGVGNKDGIVARYSPLDNEDTKTHLFVVRIDFGEDDHDVATVYRDPDSLLDERHCMPAATLVGNFGFDRISLGNFDSLKNNTHEVDEIRVGTSFTAVTGQRSAKPLQLAARHIERAGFQNQEKRLRNPAILLNSRTPTTTVKREAVYDGSGGLPLGAMTPAFLFQ